MTNMNLREMMQAPLPNITSQKRLLYRPTHGEVVSLYGVINNTLFGGVLNMPEIELCPRLRLCWGICHASWDKMEQSDTYCEKIKLIDKWSCKQWLIAVLAHEIVHQYQWDIDREHREAIGKKPIMSHGPSFFAHRERLADYGIPLSKHLSKEKWFKHQTF
jgi:hypothetical protein